MATVSLRCPQCGSTQCSRGPDGLFTCAHCASHFVLPQAAPTVPSRAAGRPQASRLGEHLALAAVLVLLALSVGWLAARKRGGAPRTPAVPVVVVGMPAVGPGGAAPGPAQVPGSPVSSGQARGVVGEPVRARVGQSWFATLTNEGSAPLVRPMARLRLLDAQGRPVHELRGHGVVDVLLPGERTVVRMLAPQGLAYASARAEWSPDTSGWQPEECALELEDVTVREQERAGRIVTGTVHNRACGAVESPRVVASGWDAAGAPVAVERSFLADKVLAPGQRSGFSLELGWDAPEEPARLLLGAHGQGRVARGEPSPRWREVPVPPRAKALAALGAVRSGRLITGVRYWMTLYRNRGEHPIKRPAVRVSLFDEAGRRVGEKVGYAPQVEVLAPGEAAPVLVFLESPPRFAREEVALVEPAIALSEPLQRPLRVEGTRVVAQGSGRRLEGTVRNEGDVPLRFVSLVAAGLDAQGELVAYTNGFVEPGTLAPGAQVRFSLMLGSFLVATPERFEVRAFGMP